MVTSAGIAGLSCAWELVRRGHDVTVWRTLNRTGGHVFTFRTGLDDGLYADAGAEQFTEPGYERLWGYVSEFNLAYGSYIRGASACCDGWAGDSTPRDAGRCEGAGPRSVSTRARSRFSAPTRSGICASLYYAPYVDSFRDKDRPFDAGLNALNRALDERPVSQGQPHRRGALALDWRTAVGAAVGVACGDPEAFAACRCGRPRCIGWSAATRR